MFVILNPRAKTLLILPNSRRLVDVELIVQPVGHGQP